MTNFRKDKEKEELEAESSEIVIAPKGIKVLYGLNKNLFPHFLFEAEIPYKLPNELFSKRKHFTSRIKDEGFGSTLSTFEEFENSEISFLINDNLIGS